MPFGISLGPKSIPLGGTEDPRASSLTEDLVSWWKLDETSGTRADSVGGNTLTDNNTVLKGGGAGSYAVSMAGSQSFSTPVIPVTTRYSFSWWSYRITSVNQYLRLLTLTNGSDYVRVGGTTNPNTQPIYFADGLVNAVGVAGSVPLNTWVHFLVVYDGAGATNADRLKAWVNGVADTITVTGADIPSSLSSLDTLYVGTYPGATNNWYGRIQNVAYWDAAIDGAVAAPAFYNSGRGLRYEQLTAAQKTGLISFWKLDEASGDRADSHGSNTLSPTGSPGRLAGVVNSSKTSTGVNFVSTNSESLSVASNAGLQGGDVNITVAAWLNIDALPTTTAVSPLAKYSNASGGDYQLSVRNAAGGNGIAFTMFNGLVSVGLGDTGTAITPGAWYYAIGWHDSSAARTYVQVNNGTVYSAADTGDPSTSTVDFVIGAKPGGTNYFPGAVEEVALWKRVLTSAERAYLYNNGIGRTYSGGKVI